MSLTVQNFSLAIYATDNQQDRHLFKDFNVSIESGKIAALMGASGSGKSSLLNFILGILSEKIFSVTGEIVLANKHIETIPTEKREIGILFQDPLLFPHMNIEQNLSFALHSEIKGRQERKAHLNDALAEAQLDASMFKRFPHTLSGGEQARVSLLRTLLSFPKALLLDEPFSKLDVPLRKAFREFVFQSVIKRNIPTLIVTHDKRDIEAIPKEARGPLIELSNNK